MLVVREKTNLYRVDKDEIIYFMQNGRHIDVVSERKTYTLKNRKIKDIEKYLDKTFFKCHSYLIVNLQKIKEIGKHDAVFENGKSIGMCYAATLKLKKALKSLEQH